MAGQRLHAQRLGGVVAAIDDVQAIFSSVVKVTVTGLARDKGVKAGVGDLVHQGGCPTGDAPHLRRLRRSVGQHAHGRLAGGLRQPLDQHIQWDGRVQYAAEADLVAVVLAEGAGVLQLQQAGQFGIVAYLGVKVQRQVGGIQAATALDERLHPLEEGTDQTEGLVPEKPVVDDEQLGPSRDRLLEGGLATVHGKGDFRDLLRPFHLEAILGGIFDLFDAQGFVEIGSQFVTVHMGLLERNDCSFQSGKNCTLCVKSTRSNSPARSSNSGSSMSLAPSS